MTRKEVLQRIASMVERQTRGEITKQQACREFDELLMAQNPNGPLIYCSDSTGLTAAWDKDLMLFPRSDGTPSNTGIYARGPRRGTLVTTPYETPNCDRGVFDHFLALVQRNEASD